MINVLIVEDDPMVAKFNQQYLQEIEGFQLIGVAHSVDDARKKIEENKVDLILLDVYMPGGKTGLDLLSSIRREKREVDVILITAASEVDKIQAALRQGVVDYLIKPFEFERFYKALTLYKEKQDLLKMNRKIDQNELDQYLIGDGEKTVVEETPLLPKGLTQSTLEIIYDHIKHFKMKSFSTDEIAEASNISRVSIRKYLKFLKDNDILEETLTYGIGRPVYHYSLNKMKIPFLERYLSNSKES
jgi:two-component system, CitB family, response regulator MalR